MRRVYYAFLLRRLKHPVVSHSVVLLLSIFMFTRVVSVPDVWRNMMEIKVGEFFSFIIRALINTDSLTWFLMALMLVTIISMLWKTLRDQNDSMYADEGSWALR